MLENLIQGVDDAIETEGVVLLPPADFFDVCRLLKANGIVAQCMICDPWFEPLDPAEMGSGQVYQTYQIEAPDHAAPQAFYQTAMSVLEAAQSVAEHIFIWGRPLELARVVERAEHLFELENWLTWYFKDGIRVSDYWRYSQVACLHVRDRSAQLPRTTSSHHFDVIETELAGPKYGFRQQGEKPVEAFKVLIESTTKPGDLVIDLMCGSGTTGEAARALGRKAILSDLSEKSTALTEQRLSLTRLGT